MSYKKLSAFMMLVITLTSCSKSDSTNPNSSSGNNIYVVGFDDDTATYWKNGNKVSLEPGGNIMDVTVSENNLYAMGYDSTDVVYWKNWKKIKLPKKKYSEQNFFLKSNKIAVSGSTVCVLNGGSYWKNGIEYPLENVNISSNSSPTSGIATDGTNVYVLGVNGVYWKNGKQIPLAISNNDTSYVTNGIAVMNNDVYVVGGMLNSAPSPEHIEQAVYWKNGIIHYLKSGYSSWAYNIQISENNVYILGDTSDVNIYWKNEEIKQLSPQIPYSSHGEITGFCVSNDNVYISSYNTTYTGDLWSDYYVNGKEYRLNDVWLYGIAVSNK